MFRSLALIALVSPALGGPPAHAQQVAAEAALRFRAYLDAQPAPAVALKIWVSGDGTVTRAELPQLADAEAVAAARTAILGRKLGVPPGKMLLPMNLSVELAPAPAPEPAAPGPA